jgi:hypothetical protein
LLMHKNAYIWRKGLITRVDTDQSAHLSSESRNDVNRV